MTVADLFEFSAPRASLVWPVNKPDAKPRVERSSLPNPTARTTIRVKVKKDA